MPLQVASIAVEPEKIEAADADLGLAPVEEILQFAAARFPGRITFATTFDPEGSVLVDAIAREGLRVDVFAVDTGLLFPETIELWETLERRYGLTIRSVRPAQSVGEQGARYGRALWGRLPDRCCELRKVEPLHRELTRFDAWITSRRDRKSARTVELDPRSGVVKFNPLVHWTSEAVWSRIRERGIPVNALHARAYPSIGCEPCTNSHREET